MFTVDPYGLFVLYAKLNGWPIYLEVVIFNKLFDLVEVAGKVALVIKKNFSELECP
jgi:hypothetical protein